ncbi:MAG: fimbrillin family protein [Dysgonamonadaceae bacterium]|jgi:hypothetical protein|nr:fimbrillin family protein [Dysgonamonadaceae bacterium]
MKKSLVLGWSLLAMAGVWTGCSNDESVEAPVSKNAISFRLQGSTPATRTTGTQLQHVDAFVVYGTDNSDDFGVNNKFIFDGVSVVRQAAGGFDYSPKRFYGASANGSEYFAYSPVNATANGLAVKTAPAVSNSVIAATYTYTLPKPDKNGNITQQDLLFTGARPAVDLSTGNNTVTFDFKHVLSRIFVTAINQTTKDGDAIVKSLKLKNLFCQADISFDFTNNSNASSYNVAGWKWNAWAVTDSLEYILADKGVVVPSATSNPIFLTSMEQGMMIIPQETANTASNVDNGDFALKVEYDLGNLKNQTKYIYLTDKYKFEIGKQYSIKITFKGTLIDFSITVEDWATPITATN